MILITIQKGICDQETHTKANVQLFLQNYVSWSQIPFWIEIQTHDSAHDF